MLVTSNRTRIKEYLDYLKKEIDLLAPLLSPHRKVVQMHWGGGTPTYLEPEEISDLATFIRRHFSFSLDAEVSVEIDPRGLTIDHLKALRGAGFNRVSIGLQDFDPKVQQIVNRIQHEEVTRQTIAWCRSLGFDSINIDLIYGLPLQTVESFEQTLNKIIGLSPNRLAVYNFAYVPWMRPHQKLIHPEDLPSPDAKIKILTMTIEKFTEAGYEYIGMDHFAKPEDELTLSQKNKTLHRNFQGYSTKAGCDLFGFGMSAISHFSTFYAQNSRTLPEYYTAIEGGRFATHVGYRMTADDEIRKLVIMQLMCDLELKKADVEKKFNIDFDDYFESSLANLTSLVEDGLVIDTPDSLTVTTRGRLFLRNIAMCFDAYLPQAQKEKPLFSRTV